MERLLPSYPLFVKHPDFSLWSCTDELNASFPKAWWGEEKPAYGFVRTEEGVFCFLGNAKKLEGIGVKKAEQTALNVTSFTTDYTFKIGKAELKVSFVSPLLLDDPEETSCPVCYVNYEVIGAKQAEVSLFLNRRVCYNDFAIETKKRVSGGVAALDSCEAAFFGLRRQLYLSNNDDSCGADWGYFYLAAKEAFYTDDTGLAAYVSSGSKAFPYGEENAWLCAIESASEGRIAVAYDDIVAIDYFGSFKKTAYLEKHTIFEAIENTLASANETDKRLAAFDKDIKARAEKIGKDYYLILAASLRQSIAAHRIVRDNEGNVLFLSKENHSNGCIATVDVSYPSIPLYLLYNTEFVKGMMRPIFKFASMPVWTYDFAPHDAGEYPACSGQAYALTNKGGKYHARYGKEWTFYETSYPVYQLPASFDPYNFDRQMPVEECANMLIMLAACYKVDNDASMFREQAETCAKWVNYLVKYGLHPENQLCTDDFAGHLKNNLNLSIKASVGIGAYALLCRAVGQEDLAKKYEKIAKEYAGEITKFSLSFPHSPLTWDSGEETFSVKYNLAFDKHLELGLFPQDFLEKETAYYIERTNTYGVPLDSRKGYTKSDWILWAASLTDDKKKAAAILHPVAEFLKNSPVRAPFTDWYETEDGKKCGFTARSVQGGCFMPLMNKKLQ